MAYGNFDTPGVGVIGSAGGDPGDGIGVLGLSQGVEPGGIGVKAFSTSYVGLWAEINGAEIPGDAYPENNPGPIAVWAVCNNSRGTGVLARSLSGDGVVAHGATGVRAVGYQQNAVVGESGAGDHGGRNGVAGFCGHVGHSGVWGHHTQAGGTGVGGTCSGANGQGVVGDAADGDGVVGKSAASNKSGVAGLNSGSGYGIYGWSKSGLAGRFDGNVEIDRDLVVRGDILLPNADIAEDFDMADGITLEPGMVAIIGESGQIEPCHSSADCRVAGIVSGAGMFRPGLVLDRQENPDRRAVPIALMGKACCYADASYGAIRAGDLLTTSPTLGHAMKISDPSRAVGALIGKALGSLCAGRGLVPVFIMGR